MWIKCSIKFFVTLITWIFDIWNLKVRILITKKKEWYLYSTIEWLNYLFYGSAILKCNNSKRGILGENDDNN